MEKLILRCYCVLITLTILLLVWYNQSAQNQVGESTDRPAFIPSDPLPSRSESPIEAGMWDVVRVVDGDTLIVGDRADPDKQHRVRLIGADAPESVSTRTPVEPFGLEASEFVKEMIAGAGGRVRLAFDGEQTDRYNRVLAMVYLETPDGEVWLNELVIREGFAVARLEYRYSQGAKLAFAAAEIEARRNKRNIWKD